MKQMKHDPEGHHKQDFIIVLTYDIGYSIIVVASLLFSFADDFILLLPFLRVA